MVEDVNAKKTDSEKPDYDKVLAGKVEMMKRFKASYDKAKAEGTITYKKI